MKTLCNFPYLDLRLSFLILFISLLYRKVESKNTRNIHLSKSSKRQNHHSIVTVKIFSIISIFLIYFMRKGIVFVIILAWCWQCYVDNSKLPYVHMMHIPAQCRVFWNFIIKAAFLFILAILLLFVELVTNARQALVLLRLKTRALVRRSKMGTLSRFSPSHKKIPGYAPGYLTLCSRSDTGFTFFQDPQGFGWIRCGHQTFEPFVCTVQNTS